MEITIPTIAVMAAALALVPTFDPGEHEPMSEYWSAWSARSVEPAPSWRSSGLPHL